MEGLCLNNNCQFEGKGIGKVKHYATIRFKRTKRSLHKEPENDQEIEKLLKEIGTRKVLKSKVQRDGLRKTHKQTISYLNLATNGCFKHA